MPGDDRAPLSGITVLTTRAEEDVFALRDPLEARGATVISLPVLHIVTVNDHVPLDAALARLKGFDWIVFPSGHAVDAVFHRLFVLGLPPLLRPKVAALGPATERRLAAKGVAVDCRPEKATGASLAAALAQRGIDGARILLPQGDLARPELREGLERAGARVKEVFAYRTVLPASLPPEPLDALRRGAVSVVALASPSALTNLIAVLGPDATCLRQTLLACIGPTTAASVRKHGLEPAAIAEEHTLDGLVEAITNLYQPENTHAES